MFKPKTIIILVIIAAIATVAGAAALSSSQKNPEYVTETVKKGTLTQEKSFSEIKSTKPCRGFKPYQAACSKL